MASVDWAVPKPFKGSVLPGMCFFSSEEANHSGPDVMHGHPNKLESTSVPEENGLLQTSVAVGGGRVSNSDQKLVQLL